MRSDGRVVAVNVFTHLVSLHSVIISHQIALKVGNHEVNQVYEAALPPDSKINPSSSQYVCAVSDSRHFPFYAPVS